MNCMAGEFDFIRWIRAEQAPSARVMLPAGDDLAVLRWPAGQWLLVGADQVLDGVHFDSQLHSPRLIGQKAMNRNLSDCAAMAGLPMAAVATVALPRGTALGYAQELYRGARDAGALFNCPLVGGDTATWDGKLALSISILAGGDGIDPITRGGAKPGNELYVTGPLGGSIGGRHMTFVPRVAEARALARGGRITAMIDLSDGLSRDLQHICDMSHTGALLYASAIPIHPDVTGQAGPSSQNALHHALNDGEDYELLYSACSGGGVPPSPGIRIGRVTAEPGIMIETTDGRRQPLRPQAWEHPLS